MASETMPSLSADLTGPRCPDRCQSCGAREEVPPPPYPGMATTSSLIIWREHDDRDGPTAARVILCSACSDKLVDPHPRLYSRIATHAPDPGVMPICVDCRHREGVTCRSPRAKFNGGPGFSVTHPKPSRVHFLRRGKGVRSGWETIYRGPVTACEGKEVARG